VRLATATYSIIKVIGHYSLRNLKRHLRSDPDPDLSVFAIKRIHLLKGANLDLPLILLQYLAPGADCPKDFNATVQGSPIAWQSTHGLKADQHFSMRGRGGEELHK
jgi:hypothetical protein